MKFKRTLAAALAAVMVIGMVSCGSKDDDEKETTEKKSVTTTAAAESETSSEETTEESEAETTASEAETTTETTTEAADESSAADEEVEATYENGVFSNQYYTLTVDEDKWSYSESAGVDCMFMYVGESDNEMSVSGTLNVVSMSSALLAGMTAQDYADTVKEQYASMDGATVSDSKETEFKGCSAYEIYIDMGQSGVNMKLRQLIVTEDDGTLVAITCGAEESAYDELEPEFDALCEGFEFV